MFNNFFFSKILSFFEVMWKNTVEPDRPLMTIWRMSVVCWIPKAKITHSEYVIIIVFNCNNGYTKAPQFYVTRTLAHFLSHMYFDIVSSMLYCT